MHGSIWIESEDMLDGNLVKVYDINGQLKSDITLRGKSENVDISGFRNGLYFLQILDVNGGLVGTERLIINR